MHGEHRAESPLRAARLVRNLTQEQLATEIGSTKVNISRWERGEIVPSLYYRRKLCDLFALTPQELGFLPDTVSAPPPALPRELPGRELASTMLTESLALGGSQDSARSAKRLSRVYAVRQVLIPTWRRRQRRLLPAALALLTVTLGVVYMLVDAPTSVLPQAAVHVVPMGTLFYTFHSPGGRDVFNVEWAPDGKHLVAVLGNGTAQVIATAQGRYRPTVVISAVNVATWSPDGTHIATANADHSVRVWRAQDGTLLARYLGPATTVSGLGWSPDGRYLAAGDGSGILRIWDTHTRQLTLTTQLDTRRIWWVAWSPDGSRVALASADGLAQIWDVTTRTVVESYRRHTAGVLEVMWSPDGNDLVSSSQDSTAQGLGRRHLGTRWLPTPATAPTSLQRSGPVTAERSPPPAPTAVSRFGTR